MPAALGEPAALTGRVRGGGAVVNTVPGTPSPGDEARGVRAVGLFVRSDAGRLAALVARVERGELRLGVDRRVTPADLPSIHAQADAGTLRGKVVITPACDGPGRSGHRGASRSQSSTA